MSAPFFQFLKQPNYLNTCRKNKSYCIYRVLKRFKQTGNTEPLKGVVGLEIHAQINTKTKLFSASSTTFRAPTNSQVSVFDAALPGTLPVLNGDCVKAGVKTSIALKCKLNKVSKFDRKHYFYADLPQGYQITQQRQPLAKEGEVTYMFINENNKISSKSARITQLQLEQDSGRSLHDEAGGQSLIDLNRAGIGLMEIVTEPDFESGLQASEFVKEIHLMLRRLKVCRGSWNQGTIRIDANVSVHRPGEPLGTRSEVKNIGSLKDLRHAIDYEIKRQIDLINAGGTVINETRAVNTETGQTYAMRDKEKLQDYRFMPEPNLPPLHLHDDETLPEYSNFANICQIRKEMPALPGDMRTKLIEHYNVRMMDAIVIVYEDGGMELFEDLMKKINTTGENLGRLLTFVYMGQLNQRNLRIKDRVLTVDTLADMFNLLESHYISTDYLNMVMMHFLDNPKSDSSPKELVDKNGWHRLTDQAAIRAVCEKVLKENPKKVRKYFKGKGRTFNSFVADVMKATDKKADILDVKAILNELLSHMKPEK